MELCVIHAPVTREWPLEAIYESLFLSVNSNEINNARRTQKDRRKTAPTRKNPAGKRRGECNVSHYCGGNTPSSGLDNICICWLNSFFSLLLLRSVCVSHRKAKTIRAHNDKTNLMNFCAAAAAAEPPMHKHCTHYTLHSIDTNLQLTSKKSWLN